jgi:hypothetical protein
MAALSSFVTYRFSDATDGVLMAACSQLPISANRSMLALGIINDRGSVGLGINPPPLQPLQAGNITL